MSEKLGFILFDRNVLAGLDSVLVWIKWVVEIFQNESICPGLADNCSIDETKELCGRLKSKNIL